MILVEQVRSSDVILNCAIWRCALKEKEARKDKQHELRRMNEDKPEKYPNLAVSPLAATWVRACTTLFQSVARLASVFIKTNFLEDKYMHQLLGGTLALQRSRHIGWWRKGGAFISACFILVCAVSAYLL